MKYNEKNNLRGILIAIAIFSPFSDRCVPWRAFLMKSNIYWDTFNIPEQKSSHNKFLDQDKMWTECIRLQLTTDTTHDFSRTTIGYVSFCWTDIALRSVVIVC